MTNKFQLSSIALLVAGITVSGCAQQRVWSPELNDARQTFAQISADPVVATLAADELAAARKQLVVAENTADFFKGPEAIAHEASLAKLKTLEAQQTARALGALDSLRVAQGSTKNPVWAEVQPPLPALAESSALAKLPAFAAALPPPPVPTSLAEVPAFAAALPPPPVPTSLPPALENDTYDNSVATHTGSAQGGSGQIVHSNGEVLSQTQKMAQKLAALSAQIIELQTNVQGASNSTQFQQDEQAASAFTAEPPFIEEGETISLAPQPDQEVQIASITSYSTSEPAIAAALPEPFTEENHVEPQFAAAQPSAEPEASAALPIRTENSFIPSETVAANARLREELRAMNARPSSDGMSLTLGERYFEADSARLWKGRAGRHLDNVAAVLAENPTLAVEIEAHLDNRGTEDQRYNLTQDRATAIKSELVLRGVNPARINTTGMGSSVPVGNNNTQLGRLQNRRVEIIFPNVSI